MLFDPAFESGNALARPMVATPMVRDMKLDHIAGRDGLRASAALAVFGVHLGQFTGVPTPTLGAAAIGGALEQSGIPADDVQEVLMGCVLPAGLGQAPARQAALAAGLPKSAACTTLN